MKYLLSIIVLLALLCGRLDAATVASRVIEISADAPAHSPQTMTNVFKRAETDASLRNNITYRLLPGTNTVSVFPDPVSSWGMSAHLQWVRMTNVIIEAIGNAMIFSAQTGNVAHVADTVNLTIRGIRFRGTRDPRNPPDLSDTVNLYGVLNIYGTNVGLNIERNEFVNFSDHVIHQTSLGGAEDKNSSRTSVRWNYFENCGSTNNINNPTGPGDGTCINVIGPHMVIEGNYITNCGFGVEIEGRALHPIRGVKIINNTFLAMRKWAIHQYTTVGGQNDYSDFLIEGNYIEYDKSIDVPAYATGISFTQMRRVRVVNNIIKHAQVGFSYLIDSSMPLVDGLDFSHNLIVGTEGYGAEFSTTGPLYVGATVCNNTFQHTGDQPLLLRAMRNSLVSGNIFNGIGTNNPGTGVIVTYDSFKSNIVSRNMIFADGASTHGYGFNIQSGNSHNLYEGNTVRDYTVAPFLDAGTANEFRNNWVGTNLVAVAPITNNYAGTNVVINLSHRETQVVDATNSMLLIWTNSAGFAAQSGKQVRVTLINNKATNMNVAHTAANLRLFGQHSGTVTNGRTLVFEVEVVGTNYNITAIQQQN